MSFHIALMKRASLHSDEARRLLASAFQGALSGAIAGSRRSLDDETVRGVAQGAAIGAVGGVLGGTASRHKVAPYAGGALAGYIGSRGPRKEKERRPLLGVIQKTAADTDKQRLVARCGEKANGVSLKKDDKGFYVATHRSRSKSYPTVDAIPQSVVESIEKTGARIGSRKHHKKASL